MGLRRNKSGRGREGGMNKGERGMERGRKKTGRVRDRGRNMTGREVGTRLGEEGT